MSLKLIILVENDDNLRQSIALLLQRAGYCVATTDCVCKAMGMLEQGNYDLLISDFNIPETREVLLPKVPSAYPQLPIVILTDQSRTEMERESKRSGALFLLKPVAPERLIDSVTSILGKSNNSNSSSNPGVLLHRV